MFPRFLYLGDAPVLYAVGCASRLYGFLVEHRSVRLRICGPPVERKAALPGVVYDTTAVSFPRLLRARFARWYCGWTTWGLQWTSSWFRQVAAEFRPEGVPTASQTDRWLAASRPAQELDVPLLLTAHDNHAHEECLRELLRPWIPRQFGSVYRAAAARFSISPTMGEVCDQCYGLGARLLCPERHPRNLSSEAPPPRLADVTRPLTIAYADSLHDAESFRQLGEVCSSAESLGHRALIYSPQVEVES